MTATYLAAGLALLAAIGHSYLSEILFLRPLHAETEAAGVFSDSAAKRLASAMFHLASVCWAGTAVSMLLLDPRAAGSRATLAIYAFIYALSGLGNFWVAGKPHPGGILLLSAAALTLFSIWE
jgi:hypothetical protein